VRERKLERVTFRSRVLHSLAKGLEERRNRPATVGYNDHKSHATGKLCPG